MGVHFRDLSILLFATVLLLPGCGPGSGTVSGDVTVDGRPLEKGLVIFSPADKNGAAVRSEIIGGKYRATMVPGKKFVQISAPVVVDRRKDSDAPNAAIVEITQESLPETYTGGIDLSLDVRPGSQTKDWMLQSKK